MAVVPAFLPQVVLDSSNYSYDLKYNGGIEDNYSLGAGTYNNIIDVAAALEASLQINVHNSFNVVVSSTGFVTISAASSFQFLWKTGENGPDGHDRSIGPTLGFSDAADDTVATSQTGDYQHMCGWYPEKCPQSDSFDRPWVRGPETFVSVSGRASRTTWATHTKRRFEFLNIPYTKMFTDDADTNEAFEDFYESAWLGTPFSLFLIDGTDNSDSWTDEGDWVVLAAADQDMLSGFSRLSPGANYYSFGFEMVKQP